MHLQNFLLLLAEMLVYFGMMLALFRVRIVIGIGAFFCALGALHFTAVYLAASYYLSMPFGLAVSPGSLILYAGTMCLLLLTYIREGAFVARQPIFGLLIGTFLLLIMISLLGFDHIRLPPSRPADIAFLGQLGALMLWGTLLLFIETLFVFRLYERLMGWSGGNLWLSIWLTLVACTTFDQLLFFPAIHLGFGIPWAAGIGGWIGKLLATAFYAGHRSTSDSRNPICTKESSPRLS